MPERPTSSTKPLLAKIGAKPGHRVLAYGNPPGVSLAAAGIALETEPDGDFDVVLAFLPDRAALERDISMLLAALKPGGLLWLAYPKKGKGLQTDISRDSGWDAVRSRGWEGVSLVAVDERWSAMRFRPRAEIRSLTRGKR